jgi:hypothetical protein
MDRGISLDEATGGSMRGSDAVAVDALPLRALILGTARCVTSVVDAALGAARGDRTDGHR